MPIRGASSGCACAVCRRRPVTGGRPVPETSVLRVHPGARTETPLCRLAQELGSLSGWRRYGLGFVRGALLAGALPPVDLTALIFVAFPSRLALGGGNAA